MSPLGKTCYITVLIPRGKTEKGQSRVFTKRCHVSGLSEIKQTKDQVFKVVFQKQLYTILLLDK